ncbi:hypothetical protein MRU69_15220 [Kocuria flava]|uniref:hypothetical protein n=1 Tax=Kocuria flava TaxID=446860 RepID=UPI001FF6239D|nr:hypothetical protein [Kocuria flava]MCJ8506189.1 hypothetical protein [Kocuria flava]
MRWDELFADMEAQLAAAGQQALEAEAAEQARAEYSRVLLADRLRACHGEPVRALLADGAPVAGRVASLGAGWVQLAERDVEHLVPLGAPVWWELPGRRWAPGGDVLALRLGLGHALRTLARARARVRVRLAGAGPSGVLDGTLDAVGADFADLALHPGEDWRRRGSVRAVRSLPFAALACVSSAPGD